MNSHVTLRGKIVNLVWPHVLDHMEQAARIGHISVMQAKMHVGIMGILIEVIDAASIEQRSAPLNSMHFISLGEQEFSQVRTILSCNTGDQYLLHPFFLWLCFGE
jgi:hypothetical protein